MKLKRISKLTGIIELQTGLHIGSGDAEMRIGGVDNPVIRNPVNNQPYIPGSSLKGKMRHLMEWRAGVVQAAKGAPLAFGHLDPMDDELQAEAENILKLFGGAPQSDADFTVIQRIGPARLSFWDCALSQGWLKDIEELRNELPLLTEIKAENSIDRIKGVAISPRQMERVPAGARFDFNLTVQTHEEDDPQTLRSDILVGLQLVELTGLGGSISRGYGKVRFMNLKWDGEDVQAQYDATQVNAAS